jgi:hypothetical protein
MRPIPFPTVDMTALESPFLGEELLTAERADGPSPHAAALAATSPFLQAFEQVAEAAPEAEGLAPYDAGEGEGEGEGEDERLDEHAAPLWLEAADSEVAPWAAAIDPFPPAPSLAFAVDDERMSQAFAPVHSSSVNHLCAAVVDLTGDPAMPPYAGLNDDEMIFAGSLPKICAMYAAFALRAQVQAFVDAAGAHGEPVAAPAITRAIEQAWRPKLEALFAGRPTTSFGNGQDIAFPKLSRIFTFSADGRVDFARATPALSDAALDAPVGRTSAEFKSPPGRFHDWMRLMLRWSNNTAASRCILALGYFYLNGALARANLFDAGPPSGRSKGAPAPLGGSERGGTGPPPGRSQGGSAPLGGSERSERGGSGTHHGLWLSADYAGHDWVNTQAGRQANAAGPPLAARWAKQQGRRRSNAVATAAQIASFMTLLAQRKLLADKAASDDMLALMTITPGGIGSYARGALVRAGRTPTTIAAKIGFGDDSFSHDCAIVERTVAGKNLRYVAVGLGSAPARKREDLRDLFVRLDDTIVKRNA